MIKVVGINGELPVKPLKPIASAVWNGYSDYFPAVKDANGKWQVHHGIKFPDPNDAVDYAERVLISPPDDNQA